MNATKRQVFEVTVPRCQTIRRGVVAPRLVASDRGWVCGVHGGLGCADRQSHLNLRESRAAAKSDPLAVRIIAAVKRHSDASVSKIRKMVDPKSAPGESRVPKVYRYLVEAGLIERPVPTAQVVESDFTVLDDECSHEVTVVSLRGIHAEGRRCVECRTLLPFTE